MNNHEWIFWSLVVIVLIWIILKAIGIIQTPGYLDVIGPSGLLGLVIYLHRDVKTSTRELNKEINEGFEKVDKKFERIDKKFDVLINRLDRILSTFDRETGKIEVLIDLTKGVLKK